jgi:hypothetical protein
VAALSGACKRLGRSGGLLDDASERLLSVLDQLERVTEDASPDEALQVFDEATLQVFWQRWPHVSSWGGAIWRRLNADLADAATPHESSEFHDIGGEGG